jgi:hypothetical protein
LESVESHANREFTDFAVIENDVNADQPTGLSIIMLFVFVSMTLKIRRANDGIGHFKKSVDCEFTKSCFFVDALSISSDKLKGHCPFMLHELATSGRTTGYSEHESHVNLNDFVQKCRSEHSSSKFVRKLNENRKMKRPMGGINL